MYNTCVHAIRSYESNKTNANVKMNKEECVCSHEPTTCNVVGNPNMYACLKDAPKSPQRVYDSGQRWNSLRILGNEKNPSHTGQEHR